VWAACTPVWVGRGVEVQRRPDGELMGGFVPQAGTSSACSSRCIFRARVSDGRVLPGLVNKVTLPAEMQAGSGSTGWRTGRAV